MSIQEMYELHSLRVKPMSFLSTSEKNRHDLLWKKFISYYK